MVYKVDVGVNESCIMEKQKIKVSEKIEKRGDGRGKRKQMHKEKEKKKKKKEEVGNELEQEAFAECYAQYKPVQAFDCGVLHADAKCASEPTWFVFVSPMGSVYGAASYEGVGLFGLGNQDGWRR